MNILPHHIASFEQMLAKVDCEKLSPHAYCRHYFERIRSNSGYYLKIYTAVLEEVLVNAKLSKEKIVLMDYGCGNGVLGLFAKHCGFGKVLFCDLDSYFIAATDQLSLELNIQPDGLLCGDVSSIKWHFFDRGINALVGMDVIEHIYDLNAFFKTLNSMNNFMVTVMTTASNPENPLIVRKLRSLQKRDEWKGLSPEAAALTGELPHESFRAIREKLIRRSMPNASDKIVRMLVDKTRGMDKSSLLTYLEIYQVNKRMPPALTDLTNTCNPLTSSWTERILSLQDYRNIYNKQGYVVSFKPGFYDTNKIGLKKYAALLMNRMIPTFGMKIAPFFMLTGKNIYG